MPMLEPLTPLQPLAALAPIGQEMPDARRGWWSDDYLQRVLSHLDGSGSGMARLLDPEPVQAHHVSQVVDLLTAGPQRVSSIDGAVTLYRQGLITRAEMGAAFERDADAKASSFRKDVNAVYGETLTLAHLQQAHAAMENHRFAHAYEGPLPIKLEPGKLTQPEPGTIRYLPDRWGISPKLE